MEKGRACKTPSEVPKRPTLPRNRKNPSTVSSSQPVPAGESTSAYPATSSAPKQASSSVPQVKKATAHSLICYASRSVPSVCLDKSIKMAKSTTLLSRPQFFHTLLPGFQTHLTIPSDFFSNYIKDLETTTAELKSDSSLDITWKVKLTGRILNDGWETSPSLTVFRSATSSLSDTKETLPNLFVKENGISTPAEICVLGKDGTKWPITLLLDKKGIMSFGKGWKEFVKANGLETGFTLKLMWEDTTPSFSLCCPESASDKDEEECLESIKKQSLSIDRRIRDKPGKQVPINKKVKTDSHGTDAASSSLDNSCFVAFVTDSSLDTDTLV
ncbi:hypothetical protein Bca52824_002995 [Brassica carinata]|uniref:TF-B3 domain-containing protein n=1 Tax=Brassica carinata TaxID=52824 RepID=A0A8X7WN42_BRACI|nr:hypothetical protein Bca52824_002995 [Brassica carinata]